MLMQPRVWWSALLLLTAMAWVLALVARIGAVPGNPLDFAIVALCLTIASQVLMRWGRTRKRARSGR